MDTIITTISKWGNSNAIRVPVEILKKAQLSLNDKLVFNVDKDNRIILSRVPEAREGTLEYLFKDYEGESFQTELIELGEPLGEEKW
ncbi:MAG: AbrB/MazE/SpoVT family DNA-binding domain-containing protein [Anaerovoracaceae bacterium]